MAGPGQILGCALAQAHPITIIECYLLLIDARRSSVVLDSFKALFAKLFPQNRSDLAFPFCCFWVKKGGKDLNYKRLRSLWNYKSVCLTPQNRNYYPNHGQTYLNELAGRKTLKPQSRDPWGSEKICAEIFDSRFF